MNWIKLKTSLALAALTGFAALWTGCYSDPNVNGSATKFVFPGEEGQLASNTGGPIGTQTTGGPVGTHTIVPAYAGEDFTKLRPGDYLIISFTDVPQPGLSEQKIRIPQDGMITLPYNVKVKAINRNTTELQEDIRNAYVPAYYVNLTATVKAEERFYFVGGEVRNPGRQLYLGEMTVTRAIDTASGFTDFAKKNAIELRRANGETLILNANKVRKNPKLDLQVFPNDHITVPKKIL